MNLPTRDEFRIRCLDRDKGRCVVCGSREGVHVHHIMERRLFDNGGYYVENGASLCGHCHLKAESTEISCDELREKAGITTTVLPDHLYPDQRYDKWANPILPDGMRLRGELFDDPSVQKVLAPVLHLFTDRVRYPRTWHLPWSQSVGKNDRVLQDLSGLEGERVVVTEKMDGESTSMYRDYIHARSTEYHSHPSRSWVRSLHAQIKHEIPEGWRVCGENLYARHSVAYDDLTSYFLVFSVWNERNVCLSWTETKEWASLLGLETVPVLWEGVWSTEEVKKCDARLGSPAEGYVVRVSTAFPYREFRRRVGKFVRRGFLPGHARFIHQQPTPNRLRGRQ